MAKEEVIKKRKQDLRDESLELTFENMKEAINCIKKKCRVSHMVNANIIAGERFPKRPGKYVNKAANIWLVFYKNKTRNCWLFKDSGGNKFIDSSVKVAAFYVPAGSEYFILAAFDLKFLTVIEKSKKRGEKS